MGVSDLDIRLSAEEDIPRMMEIFDVAKEFMRRNGNMSQWSDNYPSPEVIANDIANGWSHIMLDNAGKPVATFCLMTTSEPTYSTIVDGNWLNNHPYLTIHRIASDGSRSGILKMAVEFALRLGKDIRIDTHADNHPMHNAVTRLGFTRCGIITLAEGSKRTAYQLINTIHP